MDTPPPSAQRTAIWILAVLLVSFVLYAPSVGNDFTWDDRWMAMGSGPTANPLVTDVRPLGDYFTEGVWPQRTDSSQAFRPLCTLSYALTHAAFGDTPMPGHLINVLLHVAATGLAMALLLGLGLPVAAAVIGGLVFASHAIHSEAVANLAGRSELLAFVFGSAGTLALIAARRSARRSAPWLVLGAALLWASFHSKESALAWAVFAPLCLWVRRRTDLDEAWSRQRLAAHAAAVTIPFVAYLLARQNMISQLASSQDVLVGYLENPLLHTTADVRVLTGVLMWGYGLWLTIFPLDLAVDYGPSVMPVVTWDHIPALLGTGLATMVLVGILIAGLLHARRHPHAFLAVACFLGFGFITSNIPIPVFMAFAERSYFAPSLGLAILAAWAANRLRSRPEFRAVAVLALGAWVGASALTAWERNHVWRDNDTLVLHEVREHPESVRMHLCAGEIWTSRGDVELARHHFEHAARLAPALPQGWVELARLALADDDLATARQFLDQARLGNPHEVTRLQPTIDELSRQVLAAAPR